MFWIISMIWQVNTSNLNISTYCFMSENQNIFVMLPWHVDIIIPVIVIQHTLLGAVLVCCGVCQVASVSYDNKNIIVLLGSVTANQHSYHH